MPTPPHLGEPKTKPTQLSVRTLNELGIQPDFIITRSVKFLDERRRDRLALFCNVDSSNVISSPDLPSVYGVPLVLEDQKLSEKILSKLGLKVNKPDLKLWTKFIANVKKVKEQKDFLDIVIVGKYFGTGDYELRDSYAALFDALDHASFNLGIRVRTRWINAQKIEQSNDLNELIGKPDGLIVPIGWGERGAEGMIKAAGYARSEKIPYLGLCYGMQLAAISYARDVLGIKDANTEENSPKGKNLIIHLMPKQKGIMARRAYGGTMRLGTWDALVKRGTIAYQFYDKYHQFLDKKKGLTSERHRHRYEFNNKYADKFEKSGFKISARSVVENLVEIMELPRKAHPFYLGTQGHPEYKSRPLRPHPIFLGFIETISELKKS